MNYAAVGQLIGAMITNGLEYSSSVYDLNGNWYGKSWWSYETIEKFAEKAKCIVYQYGNYTDVETGLSVRK